MIKTIRLAGFVAITAAVLFNATTHAQLILTNGLVAYYPFNGNADDSSGNGLNAITNSGVTPVSDRFGKANSAYQFNGTTGYINVADPAGKLNFDARSNNYSVSLWVALNATNFDQKFLCDRYSNSPCAYDIYYRGSLNAFIVDVWDGGSGGVSLFSHAGTSTGMWHQLVFVVSNRFCRLFLDGAENTGGGSALKINTGTTKNVDGIRQIGSDGYFSITRLHGIEDDIRIYNRALSTNEIQMLYQYESGSAQLASTALALQLNTTNLVVGASYQLQASPNLITWTNYGTPFIATATNAPQYVSLTRSNGFFRILPAP